MYAYYCSAEAHWGSQVRQPNLLSKLRVSERPCLRKQGGWHRGKRNGSCVQVLFQEARKMDTSAREHSHSCIRAKLGFQAIKHLIATQHLRDTLVLLGVNLNIGQVAGVMVVDSIEDNLSRALYSFSPCLLLKNKKPSTINLFAASYNYIIHDELTGV